jgi:hypothetical protein
VDAHRESLLVSYNFQRFDIMSSKRDLLVLSKNVTDDPTHLEKELEILNSILFEVETLKQLCQCCEVININTYKIIQKPFLLEKIIRQKTFQPFQFLFNKN